MHDPSRRRAPGWHLPEFLDPDRIRLGAPAIIQSELPDERLRQIAADAIGEDRDLRVDVAAGLEGGLPLAVLVDSAVARPDTDHRAAIEEDLGRRESREDVDAPGLDEPGEPFSLKSGTRSASVEGSSTAPESRCAPASRAFSRTAMVSGSPPCSFCSC